MTARRVLRAPATVARAGSIRLRSRGWPDRSRLFVVGDTLGWALDDEAAYVSAVARRAGYLLAAPAWARFAAAPGRLPHEPLCGPRPDLDGLVPPRSVSRTSTAGPGHLGSPSSTARSRRSAAIPRGSRACRSPTGRWRRPCLVPGSIRRACTASRSASSSTASRRATPSCGGRPAELLGLPPDAFLVGSFQKDGVGLRDGLEPKSIKAPDVLVEALDLARREIGGLVVLLTGSRARLRTAGARAAWCALRPPAPSRSRRADGRVPRSRCVRRGLSAGGRAEERARVAWRPASHSSRAVPGRPPTSWSTG